MSDHQEGPAWWQAADGRWYPPEQHPRFAELREEVAAAFPVDPEPSPGGTAPVASPPTAPPLAVGGRPPAERPVGVVGTTARRGAYWFSPPAAIAIVGWLMALVFGALTPGSIGSFMFFGFSALWTARAVMRLREGYGAVVMTASAGGLAVLVVVVGGASFVRSLTDPLIDPTSPTLPDDVVPDDGDRIAWYQLERGWCFDVDGANGAGDLTFVRIRSCDGAHDAQALVARRGDEVLQQVVRGLAAAGAAGSDPSTTVPPVGGTEDPRSTDPLFDPLVRWCEELASTVLIEGAPESLAITPIYSSMVATSSDPVVVCAVVAGDGGVLTRDFTR